MNKTQNWKNNERMLPKIFAKYGVEAERITRGGNFAESIYDCKVMGAPELKIDAKFSVQGFSVNRKLEVVREKYCQPKTKDIPVLYHRGYKEREGKVTIDAEYFALLIAYWLQKGSKEELEKIFYG